jgi:hypothetical protein
MRAIVLMAVAVLAAAAVGACEDEPSAAPPPGVMVPCGKRVEGPPGLPELKRRRDVITSGIVFYGLREEARRTRRRPEGVARRYRNGIGVVKVLVGVWSGMRTRVTLEGESRWHAGLMYGPSPEPRLPRNTLDLTDRAVEFRACPTDEPRFSRGGVVGPLTQFSGGLLVARAHCLRLRVAVAGQGVRRVSLGYGVPPERC